MRLAEFIGIASFSIIFIIVVIFLFLNSLEFINPSSVQIQLFGIHLTLFGGFFLFINILIIGVLNMFIGLSMGLYALYKDT